MTASPTDHAIAVELRYFAAAAEAAGRPEERLELPAGTTLAALREQLGSSASPAAWSTPSQRRQIR